MVYKGGEDSETFDLKDPSAKELISALKSGITCFGDWTAPRRDS